MTFSNLGSTSQVGFSNRAVPGQQTPVNTAFQLGNIYAQLDPNSLEAEQIQQRITLLNDRNGGSNANGESPVGKAFQLGVVHANLNPNSQEARQIQQQVKQLNNTSSFSGGNTLA